MPTGWGGADPTADTDTNDYELGVEYLANSDLTITHIRVWGGPADVAVTNRKGRIWTTGGAQLGIASLPDTLPSGWSQYALDTPVERPAGSRWVVSYSTGGRYAVLLNALNSGVNSSDNAVTALAAASGTHGNGSFNPTPATFPTTASGSNAFYGADFAYTLGIGGNTAPQITELTVTAAGAVATATVVAIDAETLAGAVYFYDWGDGSTTTSASATAQHTYAASGTYAVLVSVTDSDGLSDFAARPVTIDVPSAELAALNAQGIIDAVVSHALASGRFERVNAHEPASPPATGGLTAAVWADWIGPARAESGLRITTALLRLNVRIYTSITQQPADAIDPNLLNAVDVLMTAYSGDFTLGGLVREVDLLGRQGQPLAAQAGYLTQSGQATYRVMTITLPLIKDSVWDQVP